MTDVQMMAMAKKALHGVNAVWLVYVLETVDGNIHIILNNDFQKTLDTMAKANDTVVVKMVAMWQEGSVDVPSYAFRKALLALDPANGQTEVILQTESGYITKAIRIMM